MLADEAVKSTAIGVVPSSSTSTGLMSGSMIVVTGIPDGAATRCKSVSVDAVAVTDSADPSAGPSLSLVVKMADGVVVDVAAAEGLPPELLDRDVAAAIIAAAVSFAEAVDRIEVDGVVIEEVTLVAWWLEDELAVESNGLGVSSKTSDPKSLSPMTSPSAEGSASSACVDLASDDVLAVDFGRVVWVDDEAGVRSKDDDVCGLTRLLLCPLLPLEHPELLEWPSAFFSLLSFRFSRRLSLFLCLRSSGNLALGSSILHPIIST